jgi:uncharacterized membrane protein
MTRHDVRTRSRLARLGISLMRIGIIAVLAFLIWVAYVLITSATRRPGGDHGTLDARGVLDQRLARGEIDTTEYQRLRSLIGSGDHQVPADARSKKW